VLRGIPIVVLLLRGLLRPNNGCACQQYR
jgi:hypothetical protein